jgi:tetratricopeptide (TPR) repeat protein
MRARTIIIIIAAAAALPLRAARAEEPWLVHQAAGNAAEEKGDYFTAEREFQALLEVAEASGKSACCRVPTALSRLGSVETKLGKFADAEAHLKRAVKEGEPVFGASSSNFFCFVDNLGVCYYQAGRYAEALPVDERALAIAEKRNDPAEIALARANLAALQVELAHYPEAEKLFAVSLADTEKLHGKESLDVAKVLNNFVMLRADLGDFAEAEKMGRSALAIEERFYRRKDHPDLVPTIDNLAFVLWKSERRKDAEALFARSLEIAKKELGESHYLVGVLENNLGELSADDGRARDASVHFKRAMAVIEASLGKGSPTLALPLNNLAILYKKDYARARKLLDRSLAVTEESLGKGHPQTALVLCNLAVVLAVNDRGAEAEPHVKRAIAIRERGFGREHPLVADALEVQADVFASESRKDDAVAACRRALAMREKLLPAGHPSIAKTRKHLAEIAGDATTPVEAEPGLPR